jgi:hypothetical protein
LIKTIGLAAMTGRQKGNGGPEKGCVPVSIAHGATRNKAPWVHAPP